MAATADGVVMNFIRRNVKINEQVISTQEIFVVQASLLEPLMQTGMFAELKREIRNQVGCVTINRKLVARGTVLDAINRRLYIQLELLKIKKADHFFIRMFMHIHIGSNC